MNMKSWLVTEFLKPTVRRLGTGVSAYLIGMGAAATVAQQITLGFVALAMFLIELVLSSKERKK